jgi:hypothetical protein
MDPLIGDVTLHATSTLIIGSAEFALPNGLLRKACCWRARTSGFD